MAFSRLVRGSAGSVLGKVLTLALLGCGGAASTVLEQAPVITGETSDASTVNNPPPSSNDASTPPPKSNDAGAPPVTSEDAGGSPGVDASPPINPPAKDAGVDAAPPPPADPGISCGGGLCDPATQVCCLSKNASDFNCDTQANCDAAKGLSIPCDKTLDCLAEGFPSGTVCCVTTGNGSGNGNGGGNQAASVACVAEADCQDSSQAQLCAQGGTDCPADETCTRSTQTIPPYFICE